MDDSLRNCKFVFRKIRPDYGKFNHVGITLHRVSTSHPFILLSKSNSFAHKERLSFSGIENALIATPNDLSFLFREILGVCKRHSTQPRFVNIDPTLEAHNSFLNQGGMIFVANDINLSSMYPEATMIPLDNDSTFEIPIYIAFQTQDMEWPVDRLVDYLRRQFLKS
ncbi:MAG: hypothetical protein LBG81_02810 [Coriobacteriaceae bacterium]|jgi:hypothetical protein|nr:hypothetical protein [Coriobacteriaceae bacterium]